MPKPDDFILAGTAVAPGSRKTVHLPVSVLSDHTPMNLAVHVVHGRRPGPTVFVSAGVHGDEVIGVEILRRVLKMPSLDKIKGTLLAVPIVNGYGFINRSRYLPDRRDLNRSFPGSETGSLAARLANRFFEDVVLRSDLGIDLHSAAVHRTNYPQIRITPDDARMAHLAQVFGAPITIRSPLRDGSLRQVAKSHGKDILLYEAGEALRFDEVSARAGVAGIGRVLHEMGMISSRGISKPKAAPQVCTSSSWLRAPMGGLLRTYKGDGEIVRKGDVLATISDPFGDIEKDILTTIEGIIVGRAVMPVVNEGDALFHIGRFEKLSKSEGALDDLSEQLSDDPMFDEDEII